MGTITDCFSSIRFLVYQKKTWSMEKLLAMLDSDFKGFEKLHALILNKTPHYGNDDPDADDLVMRVFETYYKAIDGRRNTKGGTRERQERKSR